MYLLRARRNHHDLCARGGALVQIDDVLVDHPNAAGRHALADGPGFESAVDAVQCVLVALPKIHGARTQGVARSARHPDSALELRQLPPQFGLARNHFLGRVPVRPFLHVFDGRNSRPAETLSSNTDSVTDRPSAALDEVQEMILCIDYDRAGWFAR